MVNRVKKTERQKTRREIRKQRGKKPGGKYIESKHLCMVDGAKNPDRQKNPGAKKPGFDCIDEL